MEKESDKRLVNESSVEEVNKKEEIVKKENDSEELNKKRPGCNRKKCFCAR